MNPASTSRRPEHVTVRICACGTVSLRDGDIGGDAVSLTPAEAEPLLAAISAAFVPGAPETDSDHVGCLHCVGSLVTGPRPWPFGALTSRALRLCLLFDGEEQAPELAPARCANGGHGI